MSKNNKKIESYYFLFIKGYSYKDIKKKIQLLYFFYVTDIIFTLLLLKTEMFQGINGIWLI
ncbi:hypothetical protein NPD11_03220 [Clostridium baratii]|nr:hypothetical protein NPD11_03220 [Clostridium baratii]